jgi:hypothetical protein
MLALQPDALSDTYSLDAPSASSHNKENVLPAESHSQSEADNRVFIPVLHLEITGQVSV